MTSSTLPPDGKDTPMKPSKPHYAPWERTDSSDDGIQKPLDQASPEQMRGIVQDLRKISESRKERSPGTKPD